VALQFVVEDGTGLSNATSYVAEADADQYFDNRPNHASISYWSAASSAEKQGALVEATAYLDSHYIWASGVKTAKANALDWPRLGAYDAEGYEILTTEIPQRLQDACCELAIRILAGETLMGDTSPLLDSAQIGPLSVDFASGSPQTTSYTWVNELLRGLIRSMSIRKLQRG
jgi:hypothetical protein